MRVHLTVRLLRLYPSIILTDNSQIACMDLIYYQKNLMTRKKLIYKDLLVMMS
jgi:hypothetical protein